MNKKGFTLIELLAVIVILAIIALIAVPIVINIINESRLKAAERSMENFVEAIKLAESRYQTKSNLGVSGSWNEIKDLVKLDNENQVTDREVVLDEKGEIVSASAKITGYYCTYTPTDGSKCSKEEQQTQKLELYIWYDGKDENTPMLGSTINPKDYSSSLPSNINCYSKITYNESNEVTKAEACANFNIDGSKKEHCLQAGNEEAMIEYLQNLKTQYKEKIDCSFNDMESFCTDGLVYLVQASGFIYSNNTDFHFCDETGCTILDE